MTRALQVQEYLVAWQRDMRNDNAAPGFIRRQTIVDALSESYPDGNRGSFDTMIGQAVRKLGIKSQKTSGRVFYTLPCAAKLFMTVEDWYVDREAHPVKEPKAVGTKTAGEAANVEVEAVTTHATDSACAVASPRQPTRFSVYESWCVLYCDVMTHDRDNLTLRMEILKHIEEVQPIC